MPDSGKNSPSPVTAGFCVPRIEPFLQCRLARGWAVQAIWGQGDAIRLLAVATCNDQETKSDLVHSDLCFVHCYAIKNTRIEHNRVWQVGVRSWYSAG